MNKDQLFLNETFESMPTGIVVLDRSQNILIANKKTRELFSKKNKSLGNQSALKFFGHRRWKEIEKYYLKALKGTRSTDIPTNFVDKGKKDRQSVATYYPIYEKGIHTRNIYRSNTSGRRS